MIKKIICCLLISVILLLAACSPQACHEARGLYMGNEIYENRTSGLGLP